MKLLFSSWLRALVDNREKSEDSWSDCPSVTLPETFGKERQMTAFMGWGGVVIISEPYDIVEMAYEYAKSLQASSCAKCFPCRVGTKVIEDLLHVIVEGRGSEDDLDRLATLCHAISKNSKCGIGQLGPKPITDTLLHFKDDYRRYISGGEKRSNFYYPYKMTAPCTSACPTGMDIPLYIEHVKEENFTASLKTIREASVMANMLGRACFHPCENNCRRANVETSLSICKIKRFAWDYEDQHAVEQPANPNKHTREEKVAVIGGGIAGMVCAYNLALKGYRVTVFEKLPYSGGASRTGIPQYRVPNEAMDKEARYVKEMGVEIKYNVHFGKDETFKSLREKEFKAFFLATGADLSKPMRVEGENEGYDGFYNGIEILHQVKQKLNPIPKREKTLVVGGGNTAMDCCRTFARLGSDVAIVYRRTEKELPADPHEYKDSLDEGVEYMFLEAPSKIIAENGKIVGLLSQKMELGEPDESGRRRPVPIEGSEHVIDADCIISAIGQDCDISYLSEDENIKISKWKTPIADEDTLRTDTPDVFAGGDCMTGPATLVDASGQGKRAAQSIDQFIRGEKIRISDDQWMEKIIRKIGAYDKDEVIPVPKGWSRQPMPICDRDKKLGSFEEVELGYTQEQVMDEAGRCMRCYIVGMACVTNKGDDK
ncbi:NADH-dependent reduced ferredoxin:NADP+ oxidoreductase subunit B [hydrothermal vent metagenome]|uniref:NADH-dependent reduced ferredoxin:NADP+ oxidoreductase subunit B n=1 Tax=hydrothermal vent metagenome TaxID=652676 RepID=A0A3B1BFA9_9ZZZZ